jgi:acyl carrier protein
MQKLHDVFSQVFNVDGSKLDDTASPYSVHGWDSFGHLALLDAIQAAYGIQFEIEEIAELDSLGRIKQVLAKRGAMP